MPCGQRSGPRSTEPSRPAEAGFSLLELVVAAALAALLTALFAVAFNTSSGLSKRSNTVLKTHEEHRRNLDSVANALRGAAANSLDGFEDDQNSTAPVFQSVVGIDESGPVLAEPSRIFWRANGERVPGVDEPGELVLSSAGTESIVARRVPAGGFLVTRLGRSVRILMTTYGAGPNHMLETLSGHTSLTLRN